MSESGCNIVVALAVLMVGCGDPLPAPPTAVITATPSTVCYLDDYQTKVTLSGADSQSEIQLASLPPVEGQEPELVFLWSLSGAAYQIEDQDPSGRQLRVTTAGDRPLHVSLTVNNLAGGQTTSVYSLAISMPPVLASCQDTSCATAHECVELAGESLCVPAIVCEYNVDCPPCFRCDDTLQRCVPRSDTP